MIYIIIFNNNFVRLCSGFFPRDLPKRRAFFRPLRKTLTGAPPSPRPHRAAIYRTSGEARNKDTWRSMESRITGRTSTAHRNWSRGGKAQWHNGNSRSPAGAFSYLNSVAIAAGASVPVEEGVTPPKKKRSKTMKKTRRAMKTRRSGP